MALGGGVHVSKHGVKNITGTWWEGGWEGGVPNGKCRVVVLGFPMAYLV